MTDEPRDSEADGAAEQFMNLPTHLRERLSSRREFLTNSALVGSGALALSAGSGVAGAQMEDEDDEEEDEDEDDAQDGGGPQGFNVEVVAGHAEFTGDVTAMFSEIGPDGNQLDENLPCDASNLILVRATWEPGGTTGWHVHPGPGLGNLTQGELEIQTADCETIGASAGDAFLVPENEPRVGRNASDDEPAELYVAFLGIPDGVVPLEFVAPPDCVDDDMHGGMGEGSGRGRGRGRGHD